MSASEPPGEPPSAGVPRAIEPGPDAISSRGAHVTGQVTQPISAPVSAPTRSRTQTWFGDGGAPRRFLSRWGMPLFAVFVLFLGREVLLPFVFAALIAYILAPVVHWMADRPDGPRRMPRGLAIVICYVVFIALVAGFLLLLVPRLSGDVARIAKSAPELYKRINEEWTPEVARWLEGRFPSLGDRPAEETASPTFEAPLPPGTVFSGRTLPDGRLAIQLAPGGIDLKLQPDGSYRLQPKAERSEPATLEDKLRAYVKRSLVGLQSKLNDVVRLGQSVVAGFVRGIFLFFFTLMIGAFILIDLEKVHAFLRSLFPANVRDDYDVIIAGIDRGMSGVIRGQLLICLVNGVLTYIGLLVFGVKYGLILGVVAGLMSLVPIFGSILSSVPIVLVALVSGDDGIDVIRGVAMVLWIIGIHFIEANLLNPKIIGTAAKIHPVLVIFSLFLGEHAYGLVGALLAVPVLSATSVLFMYFYKKAWKDAPRGSARSGPISLSGVIPRPTDAPPGSPTGR